MTFAEKLRGLLEKATPGPWSVRADYWGESVPDDIVGHIPEILLAETSDGDYPTVKDLRLVVALVNAAPALVRLLEYLNAEPVSLRQVFYALDELDKEAER